MKAAGGEGRQEKVAVRVEEEEEEEKKPPDESCRLGCQIAAELI